MQGCLDSTFGASKWPTKAKSEHIWKMCSQNNLSCLAPLFCLLAFIHMKIKPISSRVQLFDLQQVKIRADN